jgi:hypothetical protein
MDIRASCFESENSTNLKPICAQPRHSSAEHQINDGRFPRLLNHRRRLEPRTRLPGLLPTPQPPVSSGRHPLRAVRW